MRINYELSEENLKHLHEFVHYSNEYNDKPKCKYGQQCRAYLRLQNDGNRLDDRCHTKLYNHPPRTRRQLQLAENMNSFIVNTKYEQNQPIYKPTDDDNKLYEYNDR
eukprot:168677_1